MDISGNNERLEIGNSFVLSSSMPQDGGIQGIWKAIFHQPCEVRIPQSALEVLDHPLNGAGHKRTTLGSWSHIWVLELSTGIRTMSRLRIFDVIRTLSCFLVKFLEKSFTNIIRNLLFVVLKLSFYDRLGLEIFWKLNKFLYVFTSTLQLVFSRKDDIERECDQRERHNTRAKVSTTKRHLCIDEYGVSVSAGNYVQVQKIPNVYYGFTRYMQLWPSSTLVSPDWPIYSASVATLLLDCFVC